MLCATASPSRPASLRRTYDSRDPEAGCASRPFFICLARQPADHPVSHSRLAARIGPGSDAGPYRSSYGPDRRARARPARLGMDPPVIRAVGNRIPQVVGRRLQTQDPCALPAHPVGQPVRAPAAARRGRLRRAHRNRGRLVQRGRRSAMHARLRSRGPARRAVPSQEGPARRRIARCLGKRHRGRCRLSVAVGMHPVRRRSVSGPSGSRRRNARRRRVFNARFRPFGSSRRHLRLWRRAARSRGQPSRRRRRRVRPVPRSRWRGSCGDWSCLV